jgi:hypothetical protein
MNGYRPWGLLHWTLERAPDVSWSVLGCLSPEERCLATWHTLRELKRLSSSCLIRIESPESRFTKRINQKLSIRISQFLSLGGRETSVQNHGLFARTGEIMEFVNEFLNESGPNIILDITCFPKRFFFPIIKLMLRERDLVENLIVAYGIPNSYPTEPLAENFLEWRTLPLFGASDIDHDPEILVINVGHLAMGLPDEIEHIGPDVAVKLIFPFPAGPQSFQKSWNFVRIIEKNLRPYSIELRNVDANDTTDAYEHLLAITDQGKLRTILAPYGPKPISLAMCLFANSTGSPVFYTQPRVYNPDYSLGIREVDGYPEVYGYCIRLKGKDYYGSEPILT